MLWRRSIRVFVCAIAYVAAFLAFALLPGTDVSLLIEMLLALPFGK